MLSTIITHVTTWSTSLAGILTIIILTVTAARLILTHIRTKYGQDSSNYKTAKMLSGVVCLILGINGLSLLFSHCSAEIWGFINQSLWHQATTFVVIYIVMCGLAFEYYWTVVNYVSNAALVFFMLHLGTATNLVLFCTIVGGIIAIGMIASYSDHVTRRESEQEDATNTAPNIDTATVPGNFFAKHGTLALILWVSSVIAAYIAGEFSLVPKAVEYVQAQYKKYFGSNGSVNEATETTALSLNNLAHSDE